MSVYRILLVKAFLLTIYCCCGARPAGAAPADCLAQDSLDGFVACVKGYMAGEGSEAYVAPTPAVLDDWRTVVHDLMTQPCAAVVLPPSLQGRYTVAPFVDAGRSYCVLVETTDADADGTVDRGWGTVVVYEGAGAKPLSIDVPHPLHDTGTPEQGIAVFKGTSARTFVMAGAHRHASVAASPCQNEYGLADAAHNAAHTFQAATEALDAFYHGLGVRFTAVQFHGMGETTCPTVDVYVTHGTLRTPLPNSVVDQLKTKLAAALPAGTNWDVAAPGDAATCSMNGTDNVQGRLFNGVAAGAVCSVKAQQYTGNFVHIEQKSHARAASAYGYWIQAINNLDFAAVPHPPAYWLTGPNGGETWEIGTTQTVTWTSQNVAAPVEVALLKDGVFHKRLAEAAPNTGTFAWFVPSDFEQGGAYTIRLTGPDQLRDVSDALFSIATGPNSAVLTLTSPNGGETWTPGASRTVTWTTTPNLANVPVYLALLKDGAFAKTIASSTANDGTHTWTVPSNLSAGSTYTVRIRSTQNENVRDFSDAPFTIAAAGAAPSAAAPTAAPAPAGALALDNYPNPFNPVTTLRYTLPADAHVVLKVYDLLGREVATLVDGAQHGGTHEVRFDAAAQPSGFYLYRVEADGVARTGRMLLLK